MKGDRVTLTVVLPLVIYSLSEFGSSGSGDNGFYTYRFWASDYSDRGGDAQPTIDMYQKRCCGAAR